MRDPVEPEKDASTPEPESGEEAAASPDAPEAAAFPASPSSPMSPVSSTPLAPGGRWAARWSAAARWLRPDRWRTVPWGDLLRDRLVPRGHRSSRFEPGPLGLLGVMLAAMAITLLIIQTGSSGFSDGSGDTADEPTSVPGPPEGELRIMPVGDSLTQGSSGDYTWRYRLWSHLADSGVDAAFVGPRDDMYGLGGDDGDDRTYADPGFDTGHAARWGATSRELAADIAEVAAEHDPHYLLLLAGMEDILSGAGADRALEGVGEMVSTVRVVQGEARFVVGELPPVEGTGDDARANDEIDRFNMGVVDLAEQLTSNDSPVVVAQVAKDYAPAYDNWDEVHPNARGEVKIAAAFADALADPLGVGEAFPRPLPNVSVGPGEAPEPVAEESEDGLLLSWAAVPGATDYRVVQRRVVPDPDEASVLPVTVDHEGEHRSVLVGALFSGARYEFVVRSMKGRDEGVESEPLQLVWDDDPPPAPADVRVRDGGVAVEWDAVADATHYEVWLRALDCAPGGDFRRPRGGLDGDGVTGGDDGGDDPSHGDTAAPRPESEPDPPAAPDPGPDQPSPPVTTSPGADVSCERRDARGPGDGEGWRTLGSTGSDTRWAATVSGDYEVVVRSYRDYVEGRFSDSVLL